MLDSCIVRCEDVDKILTVPKNTSLRVLASEVHPEDKDNIIAAYVNNVYQNLSYVLANDVNVRFLRTSEIEGRRIYVRTLLFVLFYAVKELYPKASLRTHFSVSDGFFFVIEGMEKDKDVSSELKRFMNRAIADNFPIKSDMLFWEKVLEVFRSEGLHKKAALVERRKRLYFEVNSLNNVYGYLFGTIADKTGCLSSFDIAPFMNGYIIIPPAINNDKPAYLIDATKIKMYDTFMKFKAWQELIGITSMVDLNTAIHDNMADEVVKICEAQQEKNLSNMSDEVAKECERGVKLVLISGPSSSGKTTFSKKLNIQLRVFGFKPMVISMDDYFIERDKTPLDEYGNKDFESVDSVDVDLFQEHLISLLKGDEVSVPTYNFITGKREYNGRLLKMKERSVIIIEGIHALNPRLSSRIDQDLVYKIYVSALASMSMDHTSYISTTDNRMLRRIVRDAKYRNRPCEETLSWWNGVRRGEEKHIFPYQNEADMLFNSALPYEICVLKSLAEPLLLNVPNTMIEYAEATRLLNMLSFVSPIDINLVPPSSLLREFIGGSNY